MANIYQLPQNLAAQVGILPSRRPMVVGDNLATVTTAGYLSSNNLGGMTLSPNDVIDMFYSYDLNTKSGTYGIFTVSVSGGVITLSEYAAAGSGVVLPVVDGHLACFDGTTGTITDRGYVPSDPLNTVLSSVSAPTLINELAVFQDNNGTISPGSGNAYTRGDLALGTNGVFGSLYCYPATASSGIFRIVANNSAGNFSTILTNNAMGQNTTFSLPDPGTANTTFLTTNGTNTMASNAALRLGYAAGTAPGNAITINAQSGSIITAALTNAQFASTVITMTNSFLTNGHAFLATVSNNSSGTNLTLGAIVTTSNNGSGSGTITITNLNVAALNGSLVIEFVIL